jgi:hypothetical protein
MVTHIHPPLLDEKIVTLSIFANKKWQNLHSHWEKGS